ncbi:MAG: hypothetical protein GXZ11_01350 [Tissierellia bacterium]|nr:hypothetical protein [Tissierellia bacterium]
MNKLLLTSERQYEFDIEGIVQGEDVKGKFKCKYPSVMDTLEIEAKLSKLISDTDVNTLSNRAYDLAYMMAYNEVLLIEKPDWYDMGILDDVDVIVKIHNAIYGIVDSFRNRNKEDKDTANSNRPESKGAMESK